MSEATGRLGVYLIGARGDVAITCRAGAAALARGVAGVTGLVTAIPPLDELDLVAWRDVVFGGCDVRRADPVRAARSLAHDQRAFDPAILYEVEPDLAEAEPRIRPGYLSGAGDAVQDLAGHVVDVDTAAEAAEGFREDLRAFSDEIDADRLCVVNVASTEAASQNFPYYADVEKLRQAMDHPEGKVPASVVYAFASIEEGVPYVNFTPSAGSSIPALRLLARERGVPHAGRDGKTGETFLKSVLAPALLSRGFRARSWSGVNLLGNRDGLALEDPGADRAKAGSKDRTLRQILGDRLDDSLVKIDYVRSLGDRKTFWDYVDLEGFLGSEIELQVQWRGSDSALAAPLVLDLVRLVDRAARLGEGGELPWLASFFKDPLGVDEMAYGEQLRMLLEWAEEDGRG